MLLALYVFMKPPQLEPSPPVVLSHASTPLPPLPPVLLTAESPQPQVVTVKQGQRVQLDVVVEPGGSLSAHGLTLDEFALVPGKATRVSLFASAPGTYPLHVHTPQGGHLVVGTLEVLPR